MKKKLYDYNDKHVGETIYIIGSSPSLNRLTKEELEFLEGKTTIGVNFSYEGVNDLTYAISAHIHSAVYLFECSKKKFPIFVANTGPRKTAFSYMQDFFWDDDRIVEFSSDHPGIPFRQKQNETDISLRGNTSILLLATHLAYILGAAKIVYIGFEELVHAHFWNFKKPLEKKIKQNIVAILASKKYLDPLAAPIRGSWDLWSIAHNVHKEFELILGKIPGLEGQRVFDLLLEEREKTFWEAAPTAPARQNIHLFAQYRHYLNQIGIKTCTLSEMGMTIEAGCEKTFLLNK